MELGTQVQLSVGYIVGELSSFRAGVQAIQATYHVYAKTLDSG